MSGIERKQYIQVTMRDEVLARAYAVFGKDHIQLGLNCRIVREDDTPVGRACLRLLSHSGHIPSYEDLQTVFPGAETVVYVGLKRPSLYQSVWAPRVEVFFDNREEVAISVPEALQEVCERKGWTARAEMHPDSGERFVLIVPTQYGFVTEAPRRADIEGCFTRTIVTFFFQCGLEDAFS